MRTHLFILCAIGLLDLMSSCHTKEQEPETGVSLELAQLRKQNISDVEYTLQFTIPEQKENDIAGKETIQLNLNRVEPVILDFRKKDTQVKSLTVNGQPTETRCVNEHIVIPEAFLQQGANAIEIDFIAGNQSLNRNDEYLYTLLVPERARTLFPCFDQPDMKAAFTLQLDIPITWEAVANAPLQTEKKDEAEGRKVLTFEKTLPISTYLFSFVAGKWQKKEETRNGQTIGMYYRETDPQKTAQSNLIFDQVFASLQWMEEYTGVPFPFPKYDLVVVPGFQFGGMEHPGAVLYNDKRLFLGPTPTPDQELKRRELIAHETAHMWFGDAVTMEWFNDVWTKEVFANYLAAQMINTQAADTQATLNELRNFYIPAYQENRTAGATSVKQYLPNLEEAGLIYGQMVYYKAPIVMRMLVDRLGKENFREGIREYVKKYLYKNTTWEDLITILDHYTAEDLVQWSHMWVSEESMPEISASWEGNRLIITQDDPSAQGLVWVQNMDVTLIEEDATATTERREWTGQLSLDSVVTICHPPIEQMNNPYILLNSSGVAYGYCKLDERTITFVLQHFRELTTAAENRLALLINLYENYLHGRVDARQFTRLLTDNLQTEREPFIISASIAYLKDMAQHGPLAGNAMTERALWELTRHERGKGCQQTAFSALVEVCRQPDITAEVYRIWETQKPYAGLVLSETDYMKMAYELSIRMPEQYETLKATQLARISDPDRRREFLFVVRAAAPERAQRDELFNSLLVAENRRIEPWVVQTLGYLNHPLRQEEALPYILPALQVLREVQRTGDIFFPKNWIVAVLNGHNSTEAAQIVETFVNENPRYPTLLKNKILQAADHLFRLQGEK